MLETGGLYTVVRGTHLGLVAIQIPAALWWFLERHQSGIVVVGLAWLASVLSLLFLLPMDQAHYPIALPGALVRTGPILLNLGLVVWAERDWRYAAFFGTASLLAGLTLLLGYGVLRELKSYADPARRKLAMGLLVPLAFLFGFALWGIAPDVMLHFSSAKLPVALFSGAVWLMAAVGTAQAWFGQSVWGKPDPDDPRNSAFESSWSGLTAAAFTTAFLAVTAIVAWLGFFQQ